MYVGKIPFSLRKSYTYFIRRVANTVLYTLIVVKVAFKINLILLIILQFFRYKKTVILLIWRAEKRLEFAFLSAFFFFLTAYREKEIFSG